MVQELTYPNTACTVHKHPAILGSARWYALDMMCMPLHPLSKRVEHVCHLPGPRYAGPHQYGYKYLLRDMRGRCTYLVGCLWHNTTASRVPWVMPGLDLSPITTLTR